MSRYKVEHTNYLGNPRGPITFSFYAIICKNKQIYLWNDRLECSPLYIKTNSTWSLYVRPVFSWSLYIQTDFLQSLYIMTEMTAVRIYND